jgi:2-phosphosulfolactate phosphatase
MNHANTATADFAQEGFRCRLEWGRRGARAAAERADILVVVDILRFSTTAVTAVHHGVTLFPCHWDEDIVAFARRVDAIPGGHRSGEDTRFTLSPLCYLDVPVGTRVALASPNGATCARYADAVPSLYVGALVNAQAVANRIDELLRESDHAVTVLACGERWTTPSEDGELRFAVEDYLGAGAILYYLNQCHLNQCYLNQHDVNMNHTIAPHLSPEATICAGAFQSLATNARAGDLTSLLLECGSGRELQVRGAAADVRHAARLNLYNTVPVMRGADCQSSGRQFFFLCDDRKTI